ncbi:MAG TPA: DUF4307 domain-containing protein [Marmoricola sp.]
MGDPKEIRADLLADRYGTDQPLRRVVVVTVAVVLGVALLLFVAWAAWFHSSPAIDAAVTRFEVVSEHETRVQVEARYRDPDVRGNCVLRATAEDHTIVGEANLSVDELREAAGSWIPLRTERKATTVTLVRCTEAGRG